MVIRARNVLTAAVLLAGYASVAHSEDRSPGFDWTGAYFGAQAGGVRSEARSGGASPDDASASAGVGIGYLYGAGGWMFGGEFSINALNLAGRDVDASGPVGKKLESDWSAVARARFGYTFERVLPFASAGITVQDFKAQRSTSFISADETLVGLALGLGADYAVTNQMIMGAEYLYSTFGDQEFDYGSFSEEYAIRTHLLQATLKYRF